MLIGAHAIVYSSDAEADRAFFRDVLGLSNVDAGGGWLIFGLRSSELAVHPAAENNRHEFYLMCADVQAFIAETKRRGVACGAVQDEGWGLLTEVTLPSGATLVSISRAMRGRRFPKEGVVLELRPGCECCDRDLPPESGDAFICSYECTFCRDCAHGVLQGRCPNCGGELVARPRRPAERLARHPASTKRVYKGPCFERRRDP